MERISASSTAFSTGMAGAATVVMLSSGVRAARGNGDRPALANIEGMHTLHYRRKRAPVARFSPDFIALKL
ncbi:MAG TPA: hypothetical protein VN089_11635 [Duganella sp.]|nr:hypothetical protein [Duganella sp.]